MLCREITKNYVVRANIVAAILTAVPDENNSNKNICYQELQAIENCKICLPPDFHKLYKLKQEERIVKLIKYIGKMSEKECLDIDGVYKEYTDEEKQNLRVNKNPLNNLLRKAHHRHCLRSHE